MRIHRRAVLAFTALFAFLPAGAAASEPVRAVASFSILADLVAAVEWLGGLACFALGDGRLSLEPLRGGVARSIVAHPGACLALARTPGDGAVRGHWSHPSSVGGLAVDGLGRQVAVAHYGGVSLHPLDPGGGATRRLEWKGSHREVSFSPDGRFLVSVMQEKALHAWRLADDEELTMAGYPARPRSLAWSADGDWLVTSGSDRLVAWSFAGAHGPLGGDPETLGPDSEGVTCVACHPREGIVAAGYADGMVALLFLGEGGGLSTKGPGGGPVSALGWSPDGARLAFGTEEGRAGLPRPGGPWRLGVSDLQPPARGRY